MNLSNEQRLIVTMLASIQRKLGVAQDDDAVDQDFIMEAIYQEQQWAIPTKYPGKFVSEPLPPVIARVYDYLSMWEHLEGLFEGLLPAEKERIVAALEPGQGSLQMRGFHGAHESEHLAAARFILAHMQTFPRFAGRLAHTEKRPMLELHQAMWATYQHELMEAATGELTVDQLLSIVQSVP